MIRIKIRSGREAQQHDNSYSHGDGYDEYGEYIWHNDHQGRQNTNVSQSECCICGGNISGSHLVFSLKNSDHEVHTSCLITSVALISNSIALLAGLFKRKKVRDKQIEGGSE